MGMLDRIKSRVGWCRIATLLVGILIMIIGLYSHFESAWVKQKFKFYGGWLYTYHYKLCGVDDDLGKCPNISMERYFVAMIIITFALSLFSFMVYILLNQTRQIIRLADIGYHVIAAVLLVIAGIVYITSANQIKTIVKGYDGTEENLNFKTMDKIVAGAITIIQALLYGVTALLIYIGN